MPIKISKMHVDCISYYIVSWGSFVNKNRKQKNQKYTISFLNLTKLTPFLQTIVKILLKIAAHESSLHVSRGR